MPLPGYTSIPADSLSHHLDYVPLEKKTNILFYILIFNIYNNKTVMVDAMVTNVYNALEWGCLICYHYYLYCHTELTPSPAYYTGCWDAERIVKHLDCGHLLFHGLLSPWGSLTQFSGMKSVPRVFP